ncbi:MAG TPA: hypothetical protein VIH61_06625 [Waddliaceae bacterium]
MDDYTPNYYMLPILNIIKGNLVQHANESLGSDIINELSLNITEALETFLKNDKNIDVD